MITAKVGRRGQFTLPGAIRKAIGVQEGDRVLLETENGRVILRPLPQTLLDLRGSVPVKGEQDFSAIRRKVIEDRAGKAAVDEG